MYKLVFVCLLALFVNAKELTLVNGEINAHTEVFGDSTIDPKTEKIVAQVTKEDSLESINGIFEIEALSLISDNKDRDQHMYKVLNVVDSPKISFKINSVSKVEEGYKINGILNLNHVQRPISTDATINEVANLIKLSGNFSINLTDFNLEPPTMFFLTVRDQIDIKYSFNLKE
ncbi:hypothetical protein CRV08_14235 [Halarcobacter ebronensis]|uniref:Lipid/polyisoprenoid-binding YceI-like domain-containing protein n=1 Tax=Halarcobacter ebronensis TaxID=1462615 RepID=A0A4Q0Y9Y4_9BACT|nr:YceI family protein [Halarcobacter ebronensis]RXJ65819.1 hypothetical protein CRV08_14235 [Halarcobacter ebronensis]